MTQGLADADLTSLIQVMEGWAGVKVRSRNDQSASAAESPA